MNVSYVNWILLRFRQIYVQHVILRLLKKINVFIQKENALIL
jgi:hypothetical protein